MDAPLGKPNEQLEDFLKKMNEKNKPDVKICKTCSVGSCCYEGVELSVEELKKILEFNPEVAKPWFRLVKKTEGFDARYPLTTLVRNGTCVFQDKDNRCRIYKVRPGNCREFPLEKGKRALYYERLCFLFHQKWPDNGVRRSFFRREKRRSREKK